MTKTIIKFLFATVIMMTGCTSDEFMQPQTQTSSGEGIPFTATISGKAATRAITENTTDKVLVTSWAANEQVALIHNGVVDVMTVSKVGDDGAATITGTITGSPKDGDAVQVVYPASAVDPTTKEVRTDLLASQDGTLATIASKLDLRMSEGAKLRIGPVTSTFDGTVSLVNQIAIVKFSLKEDADGTPALAADKFEIADKTGQAITTVTPAASEFYVAMYPATTQTYRFTAKKGDAAYYYSKYGATLAAGTYYQSPMTLADMLHTPLTLEATEDDTEITIKNIINKTIQYKVNGKDKISITNTENITGLKAGDIVQFFSPNGSLYNQWDPVNIKPSKKTYVYGNVMSLIDDARTDANTPNFANDKTIGANNALYLLFYNADKLVFHDTKKLLLPATTLKDNCYEGMFSKCTGLTTVPEDLLPATTLAKGCYARMFSNCTGLTTLPEDLLPVTTLADACYKQMFQNCTGLTTLPEDLLPATTLSDNCYSGMFNECTSLTTAPILPAATLTEACYNIMFFNCTKLNSVTCLATDISAGDRVDNCLFWWLDGAGTADGCERKVYTNPNADDNLDWQLATSGKDGKRWTTSKYMAKSRAINDLTTNEIGWRLGSDGVAYEPVGALPGVGTPQAVTAEAVIAYVGSVPNYFSHFLAIALEDVDNSDHTWADALNTVGTYAAAHPITIGGTLYNTSTTGSTYYDQVASDQNISSATRTDAAQTGWRLPSVTDWRYIIYGFDNSRTVTPTNPSGIYDEMSYGSSRKLYNAINAACGNNALQYNRYWSSSGYTSDSEKAWDYYFRNYYSSNLFLWNSKTAGLNFNVRAVFAY